MAVANTMKYGSYNIATLNIGSLNMNITNVMEGGPARVKAIRKIALKSGVIKIEGTIAGTAVKCTALVREVDARTFRAEGYCGSWYSFEFYQASTQFQLTIYPMS